MNAVEFTAELSGSTTLVIPPEVATRLPHTGTARVIVLTADTPSEEAEWRAASYEQFLADDAPEDATALLSERALAEDWNRPEEEEAWSYLQQVP